MYLYACVQHVLMHMYSMCYQVCLCVCVVLVIVCVSEVTHTTKSESLLNMKHVRMYVRE